jgi:hypothetical protein
VVAGLLDLALVLGQRGVVAVFELAACRQASIAAGASAARNAAVTAASMACPPTLMCRAPRPLTSSAEPWQ